MSRDANETIIEGSIGSDEWNNNKTKTTEGCALLELIEEIKQLCRGLEEGLIIVSFCNKHLLQKVTVIEKTVSACADVYRAICSRIDSVIRSLSVDIMFEYSNDSDKRDETFEDNCRGHLVKYCNKMSK